MVGFGLKKYFIARKNVETNSRRSSELRASAMRLIA
jgi:hypothetical protein